MSSQYPNEKDLFAIKHDAVSNDDTSGDYVMADDINHIQDAIGSVQSTLGVNPQGSSATVSDRISKIEGNALLKAPSVLFYLGQPQAINGSISLDEAASYYTNFDHVVLGSSVADVGLMIQKANDIRHVNFYGYIDASLGETLSQVQVRINAWKGLGVTGIYCDKFGYVSGVSRATQNSILDSIHQYGLVAMVDAANENEVLSDALDATYNPSSIAPHIQASDIYVYMQFGVNATGYTDVSTKMANLHTYRASLGVRIFGLALIQDSVALTAAQAYFDYAQALALLYSLDGFYAVDPNFGSVTNTNRTYVWMPVSGAWYEKKPTMKHTGSTYSRTTSFGSISVDTTAHTFKYNGISIPSALVKMAPNSIDSTMIGSYDGDKVVLSINGSTSKINLNNIKDLVDGGGNISQGLMEANVIQALNAQIGRLSAGAAVIGQLTAQEITTGNLKAERISAGVVAAINLYAATMLVGDATINTATIGALTADHIKAAVIQAINLSADTATIGEAKIGNLSANKIATGDLAAERMRVNVISAVNVYADTITTESAKIKSAAIGQLNADRIQASVIEAVNARLDSATINAAKIAELTVDHIKATVIDAVNSYTGTAFINEGKISGLTATKITAGDIAVDRMMANVVGAVNAYATNMTVNSAKINTATIGALTVEHIKASVIQAVNASVENITIDSAKIGALTADNIKAAVISAINASVENITIGKAKIGQLDAGNLATDAVTAGKIAASAITARELSANSVTATQIAADAVTAGKILVGSITADRIAANSLTAAQIQAGSITTTELAAHTITAANIAAGAITATELAANSVVAGKIAAGIITASELAAGSVTTVQIAANAVTATQIAAASIQASHMTADSIATASIQAGAVTTDRVAAGAITADRIAASTITAAQIAANTVTASQIAADTITAAQIAVGAITASELAANSVAASNIQADAVTATKILAGSIQTNHMTAGSIDGDRITVATLNGDRITARSIDAGQLKAGTITAAEIAAGTITANQIAAGTITTTQIAAGTITSNQISTIGLDAQIVRVYNSATGEVLIGGGYIRVDSFDIGVPLSDNLVSNGIFMTASSAFGLARNNQAGEVIIGSQTSVPGGHQVWKIDLSTNSVTNKIDIAGKRPIGVAIDEYGQYGYVTVQGDNTITQIDLTQNVVTSNFLKSGMGPGMIKYVGHSHTGGLADHKHLFTLATDLDDMSIPDAFMVVDAPKSSINASLYMHHLIPVGNNPYDFVMDSNRRIYITMGTSGDIVVIDATNSVSMLWKIIGRIPISAYMSDNYHGGLSGDFGLGLATGGSSSLSYQEMAMDPSMAGMHNHGGGYGGSTGVIKSYEPRGIALSTDPDHLYVVDHKNNQLVIVDKTGQAPYNPTSGTREVSNSGANATPPQTSGMRDYMNTNGGTYYVRYRIDIGNAPEMVEVADGKVFVTLSGQGQVAILDESSILDAISADRTYYATWDQTKPFNVLPMFMPRFVNVGSKPTFIKVYHDDVAMIHKIFITVNGQNQIIEINPDTEAVTRRINVGANPMMIDLSPDGNYLYVANQGGTGNLTFVYGQGPYIGDAYLGLEGMVQHHGGLGWVPNRSDWIKDAGGNVVSSAVVEFRINEPLMNEGGYVRLAASGKDNQWAQIEQDVTTVTNYSDGNSPAGTWFRSHNGSIQVAIANGSSPNFATQVEVDEFVPRYVVYDCLQTNAFTPTADGITDTFTGLEYSTITNRAIGKTATSSVAPTTGAMDLVTDNDFPEEIHGDVTAYVGAANIVSDDGTVPGIAPYITLPSGLQSVTVDLGAKYMVGKVNVCHMFNVDRVYHGTKTEVSEDGVTWYTIYDSAVVGSGEYPEAFYHPVHGHTHYGKIITMPTAKIVRYVRDWCNGWSNAAATVSGTENTWAEIRVYGDWQLEESYVYPARTDKAGLQVATNGKGFITTDVTDAWVALDIDIKFTSWSWMTFIAGPEFGTLEVQMPSIMPDGHYVSQEWPYLTNLPHKHAMTFPPSINIAADSTQSIKTGKHRLVIKQSEGKVSLDRLRFDDYQYNTKSSTLIPNSASAVFHRYKIPSEQSKAYVGVGRQSTEGPYDEVRKNPDTHLPDNSVPLKYRFRVKASLNANGTLEEQGVAYVTSAIFETGKLSSFWRMSQSQDIFPGTRIETWDPMQPHSTGVQKQHLAFGSVNGNIILPSSIMNHHISNYARIAEHKLDLNFPTHTHTNKVTLDQITGWGTSGTSFTLARADHLHDDIYMRKDASGGITGDFTVTGNIIVTGNVDGVDISIFKSAYDTHVADTVAHLTSAEHTKLTGISTSANQVLYVSNGVLSFDGANTTVYTHATGDGSLHVPATSTTNNTKVLKAGAIAGSISWGSVDWSELTNKPSTFTPPIATASVLGGVKIGSNVTVDANGVISVVAPYVHPTTAGNLHIPVGGISGNWLKWSAAGTATWADITWTDIGSKPITFTPSTHTHSATDITDLSSYALTASGANVFTNTNTFTKFDGPGIKIQPSQAPAANTVLFQLLSTAGATLVTMDAEGDVVINANLQVTGTTTYAGTTSVAGDYSITGNLTVGGNATLGDALTDQTTAKGDLRVEGILKQVGKYDEVMRFPVYGIGGDPQFQTDDISFQNIIDHYNTFASDGTSSCLTTVPTGATRYYKLLVIYSSDSANSSTLQIVQNGTSTVVASMTLPAVGGTVNSTARTWISSAFTTAYTGHTTFQVKRDVDGALAIKYIEVIAYDVY